MSVEVLIFRSPQGDRVAIVPSAVTAVTEERCGCRIATGNRVYLVDAAWPEVVGLIWPGLYDGK